MTAPSLIHVGLMNAAVQDATVSRAANEHVPRGGAPPGRLRGAAAAALASVAVRLDAQRAQRTIA